MTSSFEKSRRQLGVYLQSKTNLYQEYELGIIRRHREIFVFIFSFKYKNSPGQ